MQNPEDHEPCPHCGRFKNRGVSIDAVILRNNKVLLIKRRNSPFKGMWALPGGYVEFNENANETIKREVKEETNLDVVTSELSDVYTDPKRDPRSTISLAYVVKATGNTKPGDDASEVEWFKLDKLPKLAFDHEQIITECTS